jgi:heavy metal sensor kinase
MHSIRFRLVLWFVAILAVVLAAFSTFIYLSEQRDWRSDTLGRMARQMTLFQGWHALNPAQIPQNLAQENDLILLLDSEGNVLASQGSVSDLDTHRLAQLAVQENPQQDAPPLAFTAAIGGGLSGPSSDQFLIARLSDRSGPAGYVLLGSPLDPGGQLHRLLLTLVFGSLFTLGIALAGGLWLADRAMRPVQVITHTARAISETDLSRRLKLNSKDELGALAETFDAMLARLQSAFERQRQFVADASHELRTPLTIVNLETSHALEGHRSTKDYVRALGVIRSENDYMSHLVNDLLTLARMDAGQITLQRKPVDLGEMAREAVERLSGLASRSGVQIETGSTAEAYLLGDRQALLQMVSNLVENAIKYASGEGACVRLETGTRAGRSWLRVSDNGPGIPAVHLPHLFDRFYRIDQARTRNESDAQGHPLASGSGLGLAIVQGIAQAHGGKVRVKSAVGHGTEFEANFPALEQEETHSG